MDVASWAMLGAILALLVLSALFSGSETAITAASRAFITRRVKEGDRRATTLARLQERKDRFLAALLVGNNFVNTTATALASSLLIAWFGEEGVVYASLAMTVVLVIFAEVLPKTYALQRPDATALAAAPLLGGVMRLLGPLGGAVNWLLSHVFRLFGISQVQARRGEEELLGAIELHGTDERGDAEAAAQEERRMLRGVLALDDLTVGDVMTHRARIQALDADAPPEAVLERLLAAPHSRMPLWRRRGEEVLGIVDARAALHALAAARKEGGAPELKRFAAPASFVPEMRPLREQLHAFRAMTPKMALVVDEYGTIRGLVTLEDIVEVVVGQIAQRGEAIIADNDADGIVEVRGDARLREINHALDWDLPEDEASTAGGLAIARARGIPSVGTEITLGRYTLRVLERRGWRIDRLSIGRSEE
ncbi:HlyC/CorC family transporter [Teichococcus aestuarii]|uniref:HlyC/CorC family transporter n=3 Tax=Teichococcus aestuarii TaxID=568898 RepID=A0A2U1V5W1_9PROT|nr:hypothetical protein CR165_08830 [Pseudoroseomonas aestuarii]